MEDNPRRNRRPASPEQAARVKLHRALAGKLASDLQAEQERAAQQSAALDDSEQDRKVARLAALMRAAAEDESADAPAADMAARRDKRASLPGPKAEYLSLPAPAAVKAPARADVPYAGTAADGDEGSPRLPPTAQATAHLAPTEKASGGAASRLAILLVIVALGAGWYVAAGSNNAVRIDVPPAAPAARPDPVRPEAAAPSAIREETVATPAEAPSAPAMQPPSPDQPTKAVEAAAPPASVPKAPPQAERVTRETPPPAPVRAPAKAPPAAAATAAAPPAAAATAAPSLRSGAPAASDATRAENIAIIEAPRPGRDAEPATTPTPLTPATTRPVLRPRPNKSAAPVPARSPLQPDVLAIPAPPADPPPYLRDPE